MHTNASNHRGVLASFFFLFTQYHQIVIMMTTDGDDDDDDVEVVYDADGNTLCPYGTVHTYVVCISMAVL